MVVRLETIHKRQLHRRTSDGAPALFFSNAGAADDFPNDCHVFGNIIGKFLRGSSHDIDARIVQPVARLRPQQHVANFRIKLRNYGGRRTRRREQS